MAKQQLNDVQVLNDEFTRIFDNYRARINEITRRNHEGISPEGDHESAGAAEAVTVTLEKAPKSPIGRAVPRHAVKHKTPQAAPQEMKPEIKIISQPVEDKQQAPQAAPQEDKPEIKIISLLAEDKQEAPQAAPPEKNPEIKIISLLAEDKQEAPPAAPPEDKPEIKIISLPSEDMQEAAPVAEQDTPLENDKDTTPVSPLPIARLDTPPAAAKAQAPLLKESEVIIKEAKRQAQRIIAEAEDIIKKESKKKTQSHVSKILEDARKEAEEIVGKARQSAEKEKAEAAAVLKQERELVTREITDKCTSESRQQAAQMLAEAREKSAALMQEILAEGTEIGRLMEEIINRTKNTMSEFETRLRSETGELAKSISQTQNKLMLLTAPPEKEAPKAEETATARSKEPIKNPAMSVRLLGEHTGDKNNGTGLFSGHLEMKSASASFDYQYLKNLKKYLMHIPGIKYIQESASEKEVSVLFDIKEPLPLLDILNHVPIIDEVIVETDDEICLIFKTAE
ncbi:MAG: hypothetical protein WC370_10620 [Dehalococcoidales bacterium]|jgi:F0F1-type ATP synthase membrane subunit b/b'